MSQNLLKLMFDNYHFFRKYYIKSRLSPLSVQIQMQVLLFIHYPIR